MNRRLEQLYELIPVQGRGVIDVGTDHGLIPIKLASSQYSGNIYASDIVPDPLNKARVAAKHSVPEDRINFLLCDGLELCPPEEVDTILIAGLGGDTICGILDRAEWIFTGEYKMVLQPMTRPEVLRYWLIHNEFFIDQEAVIKDDSHVYQIFTACLGKSQQYTDAEYLIGKFSKSRLGDGISPVIDHELEMIHRKLNGYQAAGKTDHSKILFYSEILSELNAMKSILGA